LIFIGLAGVFGPPWPSAARPWLWVLSSIVWVGGLLLFIGGARGLGSQLTPFPRPVDDGELRKGGAYAFVRHPIYGGVLLVSLAWSMVASPLALLPTAVLALVFEGKRRREEMWLVEQYPDYEGYRRLVPKCFIPFVW
jgi:protein-S-isoprenylcysteine O-methyltransferase Ste14